MKVITGPRQSGKTHQSIKLANETDAYLVVRNQKRARQVYHHDQYPDVDRFPITYDELMNNKYSTSGVQAVVIDNVDEFIQSQLSVPIAGVTLTTEEYTKLEE